LHLSLSFAVYFLSSRFIVYSYILALIFFFFFFFFNHPAPSDISTLSLHDALPISSTSTRGFVLSISGSLRRSLEKFTEVALGELDRKSTRLNSSHQIISYAVFCLKKKKKKNIK